MAGVMIENDLHHQNGRFRIANYQLSESIKNIQYVVNFKLSKHDADLNFRTNCVKIKNTTKTTCKKLNQ